MRLFETVNPVWFHQRLYNDAQTWTSIEEVPCGFARSPVKFQASTGWKTVDLALNWALSDGNWNSSLRMAMEWHTWLLVHGRCSLLFLIHPSNFKDIWIRKIDNFNMVSARLLGLSKLSKPADLPCCHQTTREIWISKTPPIAMHFWIPITLWSLYDKEGKLSVCYDLMWWWMIALWLYIGHVDGVKSLHLRLFFY